MWSCKHCNSQSDDELELCWKCGAGRDGTAPPDHWLSETAPATPPVDREISCLRCDAPMEYAGRKQLHEGSHAADLLLGDVFVNRVDLDAYACPNCGKVEFFMGGLTPCG